MAIADEDLRRRFAPRSADRRSGGGFLLAFHLPVRAVNEPVQPPDRPTGKFAPNAFIRIDEAGQTTLVMPQVEMGQGVYTALPMILAEELDADFAQVTLEHAPPSDKLYGNPHFRHSGHRQFQFDPRVLEAAAQGRRQRARHAGAGRGGAMAGRSGELHDGEERGHPCRQRAQAFLWRAGARGEQPDAAKGRPAQGPEGFRPDRQAAEAARHAGQGQRQGRLRHRRDAARHEVRDPRGLSGVRRQGRARSTTARPRKCPACSRSSCSTTWSPWSAITCGRPRRASTRSRSTGTKARTPTSVRTISGGSCAPPARRTARSPDPKATSPRALPPATGWRRRTSCRSWRTRRWSR